MKHFTKLSSRAYALLIMFCASILLPVTADAQNPLQKMFDGIRSTLQPIKDNKAVIMSVIGAIGLLLAIIAFGRDSDGQNPALMKLVKTVIVVIILVEIFFFFL
ncbi:hypothetical protein AAOE16_18300 [Ekhidna sp. MALMAid0563]|uniref:hypothetical protein n=1 Tax=Ekhidna sp. MALMAid0563 TaxID=3143937 RepID=UPI0032E0098E